MKRELILIIGALAMTATAAFGQFNTVSYTGHYYKVKEAAAPLDTTEKEASLESDTSQIVIESEENDSVPTLQSLRHGSLPTMALPLKSIQITSPYGSRRDPFTRKIARHSGVDLRARYEPVYAMLTGKVIKCGYDGRSGFFVTMQHGNLIISYCHLSKIKVQEGTFISAGTPIAISGTSGRSTGPHLHLGARLNGTRIDPTPLIMIVKSHL